MKNHTNVYFKAQGKLNKIHLRVIILPRSFCVPGPRQMSVEWIKAVVQCIAMPKTVIFGYIRRRNEVETLSALLNLCEGNHRWPVDSPHKGPASYVLMFSLMLAWTNCGINSWVFGDLIRYGAYIILSASLTLWVTNPSDLWLQTQRD